MTDRIPLDHLTSDALDALYEQLDQARADAACLGRVQALADRWAKAGPPPLGTSMARWWDGRLVELNTALAESGPATTQTTEPGHNDGPSVKECRDADRAHWTTKYDRP